VLRNEKWSIGLQHKLRANDANAWNLLVREELPGIENSLKSWIRDPDLLRAAMIEVLIRIWNKLRTWDREDEFALSWFIKTITRDVRAEHFRQLGREQLESLDELIENDSIQLESPEEPAHDAFIRSERSAAIRDVLSELTPQEQLFANLVTEPDYTHRTAALEAGYPPGENGWNLLRRIRTKLKSAVTRHPYFQQHPEDLVSLCVDE
jgi:DNA-directed RNA polymerase specialized sigma24 family protein